MKNKVPFIHSLKLKFIIAFAIISLLFITEGIAGAYFNIKLDEISHEVQMANEAEVFINQKIIDHEEFMNAVYNMFMYDRPIESVNDHKSCGLGKWYYSYTPDEYNKEIYDKIAGPHERLHSSVKETVNLYKSGQKDEAKSEFTTTALANVEAVKGLLFQFAEQESNHSHQHYQEQQDLEAQVSTINMILRALALIIAVIIAFTLNKIIVMPLIKLSGVVTNIAGGDLRSTIEHKSKDELGALSLAVNHMASQLRDIIQNIYKKSESVLSNTSSVKSSLENINTVSGEIAVAITQVAENNDSIVKEMSFIEDSTMEMGQVGLSLNSIVAETHHAASSSYDAAISGKKAMDVAVASLQDITHTVDFATDAISKLTERSSQIGAMVKVIEGIASQTNLLALNASIEAARAGENGRGFAVVADEIRKLAEGSKNSAFQIISLIENIESETTATVNSMEVNKEQVIGQVETIKEAEKELSVILDQSKFTKEKSEDLKLFTQQIKNKIENINAAVTNVSDAIQVNAANSQEVTASAEEQSATIAYIYEMNGELVGEVNELAEMVKKFEI